MLEAQDRMQFALSHAVDDDFDCWTRLSLEDLYQRHLKRGRRGEEKDPYAKLKVSLVVGIAIATAIPSILMGRRRGT